MPANLPPQFFKLQEKLKKTKDNQEKIEILKEMLAICPKHKGTERVQEEIKSKIAKLRRALPKKIKREQIYFVEKEGAGQVILIGPPNSGKTSLLNLICNTNFEVRDYPFTTKLPTPGMFLYQNVLIQLVDTPPLTRDFHPGWMKSLIRQADLILILLDLEKDPKENLKEILDIFEEWKIEQKILIVGNKFEKEISKRNFEILKEEFEVFPISVKEKINIEELKEKIFQSLNIIRVYSKEPKKEVDFERPWILKKGTKLIEWVEEINKEMVKKFQGAKLYKKDLKSFQLVGKDYVLQDGDIIEIKV